MTDPFLGMIMVFGFDFAPRSWALCQGQILSIAQNTALFSLLGTAYGGNGNTTFALPDLRGRAPIGIGQGPGLKLYQLGEASGEMSHSLTLPEMPAHTHTGNVILGSGLANSANGAGNNFAANTGGASIYNSGSAGSNMASNVITNASGGNQPHNNMSPYLGVNYCIALQGIYPSRN